MASTDVKENIKNSLDIVNVIEKSVSLTRQAQGEYTGAVSSLSKSGASLKVNQSLQLWHDMSGKARPCGGDVFDWIAYDNNLDIKNDFPAILRIAADMAGIKINDMPEEQKAAIKKKTVIQDLLTKAAEVYHANLTPEIRKYINQKWGITDETIDTLKIGYAKVQEDKINCNLNKVADCEEWGETGLFFIKQVENEDHSGYDQLGFEIFRGRVVFPYWNGGKVVNFAARGDFKEPINTPDETFEKNGNEIIKYKKLLTHSEKHPYVHESVNNGYIFGEDTVRGQNYCIITEGIADAIMLMQNGFPVLSPVTTKFAKHDIEKLVAIAKRLETIYICNDNEDSGAGEDGAIRTGLLLKNEGVDVRIMTLPREGESKVDVAEYFLKHTKEDFDEVLNDSVDVLAHLLKKVKVSIKSEKAAAKNENIAGAKKFILSTLKQIKNEDDAKQFIYNDMKNYFTKFTKDDCLTLLKLYSKNRSVDSPQKESVDKISSCLNEVDAEFDGLYTVSENEKSGAVFITPHIDAIALRVIENMSVIMYNGNVFCFREGYYKNDMISVKAEAMRILNGICKGTRSNGIRKHFEDVMTIVKNTNPCSVYPFNRYDNAIPVKNGIITIDFEKGTFTKEEHDPKKWKFNYVLPVVYDEKAANDVILKELEKYTPDYKMLVQSVAQALLQAMGYGPYKKAYLLKGQKNCGKTTFLDIVEKIIGESSKSKVALSELTPQFQFARAALEGKLMNLDDDLGYFKMSETGVFKKLTGGYSQKVERKGLDSYDVNITAVHVFTTNTPAGFDSRIFVDDAFWDRWVYIEFDHTFEKDDEYKRRVLTDQNISGLFNAVLDMTVEIRQKKQLPYVQEWTKVREKWMQESNILYKFVEENMVYGGRTAIIKEDLLAAVTKFCYERKVDNKVIPQSTTALGDLVEICGGSKDDQRQFEGTNQRVTRCFILNYVWKPFSEYKKYAKLEKKNCEPENTELKEKDNREKKEEKKEKKQPQRDVDGVAKLNKFDENKDNTVEYESDLVTSDDEVFDKFLEDEGYGVDDNIDAVCNEW